VGGTHANRGDSSRQRCVGAVAAGYSLPSVLRQCVRQRLGRDRLVHAVRRSRVDGRPRPPGGLIGSGPSPGGQRLVEDWMPTTYVILSSVIPSWNSVSTPYQASASMQLRGTGASRAARICASAICGLVWRFDPRCHRFHALAITRQDETGAIRAERCCTIGMTQRCRQGPDISLETRLHAARTKPESHAQPPRVDLPLVHTGRRID
jgi:hypothetical protein